MSRDERQTRETCWLLSTVLRQGGIRSGEWPVETALRSTRFAERQMRAERYAAWLVAQGLLERDASGTYYVTAAGCRLVNANPEPEPIARVRFPSKSAGGTRPGVLVRVTPTRGLVNYRFNYEKKVNGRHLAPPSEKWVPLDELRRLNPSLTI
jgi:hypothetical protein